MSRRKRFLFPLMLVTTALAAFAVNAPAQKTATPSAVAAAAAAASQTSIDPFQALPPAEAVFVVNVQRVLRDAVPRVLANEPKTLLQMNTSIAGFKALTGIDVHDVRRLVIGLRDLSPEKMSKGTFNGVIIAEGIDTEKLLTLIRMQDKTKAVEEDYQGQRIYTRPKSPDKPADWDLSIAALDATTLVVGTASEVRASIDANAGRGARVSAELRESVMLRPDSLASIAFVMPPSILASMPTTGGDNDMSKIFTGALASFKMFRGALGLTPTGYDINVAAKLTDSERAKATSDALEGLRALAVMEAPKTDKDRMMMDLLKQVRISSLEDEVQISTEISQVTVNSLIRAANLSGSRSTQPAKRRTPARRQARRRARG
jgi:hypothetical protein